MIKTLFLSTVNNSMACAFLSQTQNRQFCDIDYGSWLPMMNANSELLILRRDKWEQLARTLSASVYMAPAELCVRLPLHPEGAFCLVPISSKNKKSA